MRYLRYALLGLVSLAALLAGPAPLAHAATFTVDSTGDAVDANPGNGTCATAGAVCTLRAAIEEANALAGTDTINFNIAGAGPHTIGPGSALPTITDPVIIDGTSEPDFAGTPIVELDGTGAGASVDGLNITAGSSTVKGLVINQFGGDGIELSTNGSNTVEGNYVGTDLTGSADLGNTLFGVNINGAPWNTIGGTTADEGNVISGNGNHGINIMGISATGNSVMGNHIGTNAAGTASIPNGTGVTIEEGASGNTIGGISAGERNVISGNSGFGVLIEDAGTNSNKVEGNYIGTNWDGNAPIGNGLDGILVQAGAESNIICGSTSAERNVISGNSRTGVLISAANNNFVKGNYIGTSASGNAAIGNIDGISIGASSGNTVGGTTAGERNVISGNTASGVALDSATATSNIVIGNYIGLNAAGTAAVPNATGILVGSGAQSNIIGGSTAGERNVISGNGNGGVEIGGSGTDDNVVSGNYIGTNVTGTSALGNISHGVLISSGASDNTIGGAAAGTANTIAFNGGDGVRVDGASSGGNPIRGNSIHSNVGKGIENINGGNTELTPPVITAASSASGAACANCDVDVFSDSADEGRVYHGSAVADGVGNWSFPGAVIGPNVTATATDASGNTSEFSAPFPCTAADSDGDSLGLGDLFGLFFRDCVEGFIGTLPTVACSATSAINDEDPDALGPDWDDDQDVDGSDLFLFAERFGSEMGVPPPIGKKAYLQRFDIYPIAASLNKIDGSDLFVLASYFGDSCS